MEFKLENGDYLLSDSGSFEIATGNEEMLQRVLYKLMCRRGGFAPKKELGSRLHLLLSEKKENRVVSARKYILEALEDEKGLTLCDVQVNAREEGLLVKADFLYNGASESLEVHLG